MCVAAASAGGAAGFLVTATGQPAHVALGMVALAVYGIASQAWAARR